MAFTDILRTLNDSLWVCLATDALLWLLFVAFVVGFIVILRSPLQRAVWRQVFRQRLAVVSALLLALTVSSMSSRTGRPTMLTP